MKVVTNMARHFTNTDNPVDFPTRNEHYYGMFTEKGNALIAGVVLTAKAHDLDFDNVLDILYDISTLDGFEEATDTAVLESVFNALEKFKTL